MQQSLHILQIATMDLNAMIREELVTNPVLEESPKEEAPAETLAADPEDETAADSDSEADPIDKEVKELVQLDEEWRDYFNQTNAPTPRSAEEDERRRDFFESIARPETLEEHLLSQLNLAGSTDAQHKLCETLIGNLDERGYLIATTEEINAWSGGSTATAQAALGILQSFDPIGVGARDLRECLQIQIRRLGHSEESLAYRIVSLHIDDLAAKRHAEIAVALGVSLDDVHRAAGLISTLDPQPGSRFSVDDNRYITPDLVIQKINDEWVAVPNDDWLPQLRISNAYKDILGQSSQNKEAKTYVRDRLRTAKFFIKSIEQRRQTIMRIVQEILRTQIDFFEHGRQHLKPLTMTDVAQRIGVHETTVSRASANKYVQTPHGIFELKYFFTPGIRLSDGGSMTANAVKTAISDLVGEEPADHPLTDQDIMRNLQAKGISIARRTVAKYREELGVLPSHLRKSK